MELFKDSGAALAFAFRYSDQQYAISPMAKMMKTGIVGSGKGLVALDGAGQAGLIMANLKRLSLVEQACLIGRYSERSVPCECGRMCCTGETMLQEYRDAILMLDHHVAQCSVTGISKRQMRHVIIRAYFERKGISINQAADRLKVARRTAHDHKAKIWEAIGDVDKLARTKIDALLAPMVGEQMEAA